MPPSPTESKQTPAAAAAVRTEYVERLAALGKTDRVLELQDRRLSLARGLSFLLGAGSAVWAAFQSSPGLWVGVAAVTALFILFVVLHAMVSTRQFDAARRRELLEQGLARMAGTFRAPAKRQRLRGDRFVDPKHDYLADLDVFGPASVFEQLNTAYTWPGESTLASWLCAPAAAESLAARQGAARELSGRVGLREEIALEGMRAAGLQSDTAPVVQWAAKRSKARAFASPLLGLGAVLVGFSVVLIALDALGGPGWSRAWVGTVAVQMVLLLALRKNLEAVIAPICDRQRPLGRYHGILSLLEQASFEHEKLRALQAQLRSSTGRRASQELKRLESIVSYAALRHNAFIYILVNALLLWDLWCAWALHRWRQRCADDVGRWLDTLGEMEALCSLATFAHEHPTYAWPTVSPTGGRFVARALGHPLLPPDRRVDNDVDLGDSHAALMISGSNMSGKSTMLRAIGVNAVLAQAGAPVCAQSLQMSELSVRPSVRVDDSLAEGISRFYRELQRLKRVLDSLEEGGPTVLFLLDEILHGTNSRERNIGGRAIVRHLVDAGAIGAVSSHDLGLAVLEELTGGRIQNAHFTDHIRDNEMCFDYRLRPGPVATPNALRLMKHVGIRVKLEADDDRAATIPTVDERPSRG